ncbi:MAG TPA: YlmC/YmxH family sporulation protein [Clostridia bacterium]|nr:YlmC/YmxH family sporulation protein [Clostridia bacterium]
MIKVSDLTEKEVVCITDGRKIGMITDFEVDLEKGKINAIIIPEGKRIMGLFSKELEYEISWSQIKMIGEDVILIEMRDRIEPTKLVYPDNEV